jgi:hypothetical protein
MTAAQHPSDKTEITSIRRRIAPWMEGSTAAWELPYLERIRALEEVIAAIDPDDPVLDRARN